MYQDIRESSIRTDILKHVQREARQSAHRLLRTRKSARTIGVRKVLSDLDDTLLCGGTILLDWTNDGLGKPSPGVLAFIEN